jgi:arylsulfatase A-like enzyme
MLALPPLFFLLALCQQPHVTTMHGPSTTVDVDSGPRAPDVLVFVADDFNWLDLQSVAAPNITALASQGMTFRNAYVFPICSTTRYSLLFGRYPRRDNIGALVALAPPSPGNPTPTMGLATLPSLMRQVSYHGLLVGKWHLGTNPDYDGDPAPDIGPADIGALTPILHGYERFLAGAMASPPYFNWQRVDDGIYSTSSVYAPEAQLDVFSEWWHTTTRRLAVFCTTLPHVPVHVPPPEWLPPDYPAPVTARQKFEAMLMACDTLVGRVLAEVDLSRTYVFFLSDNGTQRDLSITPCGPDVTFAGCTKTTTWQGGIHVPFVVAGPGIPPGSYTDALVSSTDVMATLAELFGLASPGEDSISFAPVLFDPAARTRRIAFSEIFGWFYDETAHLYYRHELAAVGERYKLRVLDTEEFLYDLVDDPGELARLDVDAPELAPVVEELRAVIADPLDRTLQE